LLRPFSLIHSQNPMKICFNLLRFDCVLFVDHGFLPCFSVFPRRSVLGCVSRRHIGSLCRTPFLSMFFTAAQPDRRKEEASFVLRVFVIFEQRMRGRL